MIEFPYSLVIEATEEPDYFGFYSPDLEGFSGIGHSVEDCLYKAKWGIKEHIDLLKEQRLPVPSKNPDPKIIIQNEQKLAAAWTNEAVILYLNNYSSVGNAISRVKRRLRSNKFKKRYGQIFDSL